MIQLVIFDFDGTLFDTRQDIADAVNFARIHFDLPEHSLEAVTGMVGFGIQVLADKAFADSAVSGPEALPVIMQYYSAHPSDRAQLYPGVSSTLPRIEAKRAIVSNKPVALVKAMLEERGMTGHFAHVSGGDSFPGKKPDPKIVEALQSEFQVDEREILVVGDHSPDIEMARAAGTWSVFCRYGFLGDDPVGADFAIDAFPELLEVIARINGGNPSQAND